MMSTHLPFDALAETLFSKNRQAVLALLYGHPDQAFYLRQLVRAVGGGHGAVQRELKTLSQAGILRRTTQNHQVFFQANPECPVFEELKNLIVKTAGAADVLKAALAPLANRIQVALLYGSMARAEQKQESDVDVLVIGDVAFREVVAALADAQSKLRREVNPLVYAPNDFRSTISSSRHFLSSVLKTKKVFLIGNECELERLAAKRLARRTRKQSGGNLRHLGAHRPRPQG
jgi:uncharacterized protein